MNINQVRNNIIKIIYKDQQFHYSFKRFKLISGYPRISNSNNKIILIVQSFQYDNLWLAIYISFNHLQAYYILVKMLLYNVDPRVRIGYESIAREAEGRMGY